MTLFTKPKCAICGRAKRALDRAKIKYHEVSIHTAEGKAIHVMEMSGGANADRVPMLKIGEDCIYKVVTWAKNRKREAQ